MLGQLPLFQKLTPDFKLELFPCLKPISFSPGDTIYRKGAPSKTVYFLLSGEIDVYRGTGVPTGTAAELGPTSRLTPWHETDLSASDWTGAAPTSKITTEGEV